MRIAVVVFEGFDELDAIGPLEVLRTAAGGGADLEVALVTLDGAAEAVAAEIEHPRHGEVWRATPWPRPAA